jgi:hypothetical protein
VKITARPTPTPIPVLAPADKLLCFDEVRPIEAPPEESDGEADEGALWEKGNIDVI